MSRRPHGLRRVAGVLLALAGTFIAGIVVGEATGGSGPAASVAATLRTVTSAPIPVTVTVARTVSPVASGPGAPAITWKYGPWAGRFVVTNATLHVTAISAEVHGLVENVSACATAANVGFYATFLRSGKVVGSGFGAISSAPRGTPVSVDVAGFPSARPTAVTIVVGDVLCVELRG